MLFVPVLMDILKPSAFVDDLTSICAMCDMAIPAMAIRDSFQIIMM
jgi:hypothetical protein